MLLNVVCQEVGMNDNWNCTNWANCIWECSAVSLHEHGVLQLQASWQSYNMPIWHGQRQGLSCGWSVALLALMVCAAIFNAVRYGWHDKQVIFQLQTGRKYGQNSVKEKRQASNSNAARNQFLLRFASQMLLFLDVNCFSAHSAAVWYSHNLHVY